MNNYPNEVGCCAGLSHLDADVGNIFGDVVHFASHAVHSATHLAGKVLHEAEKAGKTLGKIGKEIVRSPITKIVAGGLAFVCPPAGVSLGVALVAADKVIGAVDSANAIKRAFARSVVARTVAAAKAGDRDAMRGAALLVKARKLQKQGVVIRQASIRKAPVMHSAKMIRRSGHPLVVRGGRIIRGNWRKHTGKGSVKGLLVLPGGTIGKGTFAK